jgi:hypothetical protein
MSATSAGSDETATDAWTEPTIWDAFVDGFENRPAARDGWWLRDLIASAIALMVLALLFPSIRNVERIPTTITIVVAIVGLVCYRTANLQQRLGRPRSRVIAATAGVLVGAVTLLAPAAIVSWLFGPNMETAPFTRLLNAVTTRFPAGITGFAATLGLIAVVVLLATYRRGQSKAATRAAELDAFVAREREDRARSRAPAS